jgi:mannitol-specific phosphotransferase system IIBC component
VMAVPGWRLRTAAFIQTGWLPRRNCVIHYRNE